MDNSSRAGERGNARLKFILVMLILGTVTYAGYLYVPVAYQAYLFKDLMQSHVDRANALAHPPSWVQEQLAKSAPEYGVPANAVISPVQRDNRIEVRVQFKRPIEFPGYTYEYGFDHTARSTQFLSR